MKCKILMFSLSYTEMFLISDKISRKSKNKLNKISFTDESDFPICSSQRSKNSKEISMSKQIIADSLTCNVHWCLMAHLLNLASSPNIIEKKGKKRDAMEIFALKLYVIRPSPFHCNVSSLC